ncbi:MAG: hypothetical protein QM581_09695 [Pseudomonas sp.]
MNLHADCTICNQQHDIAPASELHRFRPSLRTNTCAKKGGWMKSKRAMPEASAMQAYRSSWLGRMCSAAPPRVPSGTERRKARLKGAAPRCAQSQSAHEVGAARAEYGTVPSKCAKPHECWLGRVSPTRQHALQRQSIGALNLGK